jgi:GT2 family glycosyltransferase
VSSPIPRVSVIIPAYYSHGSVEACLQALRAQTYRDFETILVNSSPEELTGRIVTTRFPEVVFEQSSTRLLPHAARNHGVSLARGELLVFTDPDCRARPDWLARLVGAHDAGHPVVGGGMELGTDRWFERGVHLCKFSWLLTGLAAGPRRIVATANVCYAREVWDQVGPFDGELFCGDAVLSWRAAAHGIRPWFDPRVVVEHRHKGDLLAFWRERLGRGVEFAGARAQFEHWSRGRAAAYLVLLPALVLFLIARTGRDAFNGGWGRSFAVTLPIQLIGQLGWCLGEACTHWRLFACGSTSRADRGGLG